MRAKAIPKKVTMGVLTLLDSVVPSDLETWTRLSCLAYYPIERQIRTKLNHPCNEIQQNLEAEQLLKRNRINRRHRAGNRAQFDLSKDIIIMPFKKQFKKTETYYATLFHECIHWTGHSSRLNRTFGSRYSSEYCFEELVAELGGAFLCEYYQIPASLASTTAYIKSWLAEMGNNRNYILKASSVAEKAMNFLLET